MISLILTQELRLSKICSKALKAFHSGKQTAVRIKTTNYKQQQEQSPLKVQPYSLYSNLCKHPNRLNKPDATTSGSSSQSCQVEGSKETSDIII
jgi:hypothetical protein